MSNTVRKTLFFHNETLESLIKRVDKLEKGRSE